MPFISSPHKHPLLYSTILFLFLFALIAYTRPIFFFRQDGSIRPFGIGYKQKTVIPLWLFSILIAILCYLTVCYFDL